MILGILCLGVFSTALDQTVVVAALPAVMVDLEIPLTDLDRASWIVTGYLVSYTVAMPLAGGSVSVAVSGFALRNFVAIPPVLDELARVLRPGGRVGLLEVDEPRSGLLRLGHGLYFRRVVPAIGALLSDGRAYRYLPASAAYLPEGEGLRDLLAEAGFTSIEKRSHLGGAAQSVTAVRA